MKHLIFFVAWATILFVSAVIFREMEAKEILLEPDNTIILRGPVDDVMAENFMKDAQRVFLDGPRVVNVVISTNGGSQYVSQNIADTLNKYSKTTKLNIISLKAYSGGYMIHQLSGGNRYGIENSSLMWHNPRYTGLSGSFVEIMMIMKVWATELEILFTSLHKRTKLTYEEFIMHMNTEKYYTAAEALQAGIIDDIVTLKCEKNFVQCDYVLIEQKAKK